MDPDLQDESDFEPSENSETVSQDGGRNVNRNTQGHHRSGLKDSRDALHSFQLTRTSKWERLQPVYNDQYQELFREHVETERDEHQAGHYQSSQLGAVIWNPAEKERLFEAVARIGRRNLPSLAQRVGTKSQLEIKAYLDRLQSEEIDRQLFEKQPKNLSQAEIPAAIEIGPECEAQLEQAADALAAFQEQYDNAAGQQDIALPFVITHDIASQLDEETDNAVPRLDADNVAVLEAMSDLDHPYALFNLRMFVELSESVFMHGSFHKSYDSWHDFAEEGETPAITQHVITEFYNLVLSLTRRLLQTTLFMTQSRIRASTTKYHKCSKTVKPDDVYAALRTLKVENDLWSYWTGLPRRHGFKVVSGSHRKGESDTDTLSYDEVEAALSVRHFRGRRRSLSVVSSAAGESGSELEESRGGMDEDEQVVSSSDPEADDESGSPAADSDTSVAQAAMITSEDEAAGGKQPGQSIRLPANERKRLREEEQDQYLEEMDQRSRQQEEARLTSLLGFEDLGLIKEEPLELGKRPKVPRKLLQDAKIWTGIYQAEWESHPASLPDDRTEDQLQEKGPLV
jgi:RNA polymerase I-specific transcription initiation factor RRN5